MSPAPFMNGTGGCRTVSPVGDSSILEVCASASIGMVCAFLVCVTQDLLTIGGTGMLQSLLIFTFLHFASAVEATDDGYELMTDDCPAECYCTGLHCLTPASLDCSSCESGSDEKGEEPCDEDLDTCDVEDDDEDAGSGGESECPTEDALCRAAFYGSLLFCTNSGEVEDLLDVVQDASEWPYVPESLPDLYDNYGFHPDDIFDLVSGGSGGIPGMMILECAPCVLAVREIYEYACPDANLGGPWNQNGGIQDICVGEGSTRTSMSQEFGIYSMWPGSVR